MKLSKESIMFLNNSVDVFEEWSINSYSKSPWFVHKQTFKTLIEKIEKTLEKPEGYNNVYICGDLVIQIIRTLPGFYKTEFTQENSMFIFGHMNSYPTVKVYSDILEVNSMLIVMYNQENEEEFMVGKINAVHNINTNEILV